MGKRLIFRLITMILISLLFSASIVIVSVVALRKPPKPKNWEELEEKGAIIEALLELSSEILELPEEAYENPRHASYQTKVLRLKNHVAIWQVTVGAYEGAVNKLGNDIRDKIEKWIVDPWKTDLIDMVNYIIELIESLCKDRKPPTIVIVLRVPETPNYDENVTVIAQVIDNESEVESVILSYQVNTASWINITMNLDYGLYVAVIPPQPYNTTVSYKVYAYDKATNLAISETYSYLIIDSYPPIISHVEHVPASPNYNETVAVFANVTEPLEASGVKSVTLFYKTNGDWQPTEMTSEGNLYTGIIPAFPNETVVHYRTRAFDNAGNWADSDVHGYPLADTYLPLVRIDDPADGSYLTDTVSVKVYVYDDNFDRAELKIEDTIVMQWNSTGPHVFDWNTTTPEYPDGIYILQLTAYDLFGNSDDDTIVVTVDKTPPIIGVPTWDPQEPFAYEEVEVSVWVSAGGYASGVKNVTLWYRTDYEWHFLEMIMPNGLWTSTIPGQSAGVNVEFYIEAYDNVGNGAKTSTYDYTVKTPPNLPPVANFSESAETVSTGEVIQFNASDSYDPDGYIESYFWDFGDGTTAFGVKVNHAYEDDGVYTVILTVIDDDGVTASTSAVKTVSNRPPVAFFTENATKVEKDEAIHFDSSESYDLDGDIVSYFWDFGDGTNSTDEKVDHSYAEDGNYMVTLTVTDDDGASSSMSETKIVEKEVVGWPLALLAAIGLGIAALTATLLYGLYRRRRKRGMASNPRSSPLVTLYVPSKLLAGHS